MTETVERGVGERRSGATPSTTTRRAWGELVPLDQIAIEDMRFQHRLSASSDDLVDDIRARGQLTPVLLWGDRPPYIVVDGFRRIGALGELAREYALAVFVGSGGEQEVFARSFAENVRRRSYTATDKAHAIWRALNRFGLEKREIATLLSLSVRQVDRYASLIDLAEPLQRAVSEGRISMAHAVAIRRGAADDAARWVEKISETGISATELRKQLGGARDPQRRRVALVRDAWGFRLGPIRYRSNASAAEKRRIWDALEGAMRIIAESSRRS